MIRLEGPIGLADSAELRRVLLLWLTEGDTPGINLELDLERAEEIDLSILQLLAATGRECLRRGSPVTARYSPAAALAVHDSGFDLIPGFPMTASGSEGNP